MKQVVIFLIVLVIAAAGGFGVYKYTQKSEPKTLKLSGQFEIEETDISFAVSGRIDKIMFAEGEAFKTGDLLATLNTGDYDLAVKLAQTQVKSAEWALKELETVTPKNDAIKAKIEQAKSAIESAKLQVEMAKKRLADASINAFRDGVVLNEYKSQGELIQGGFPVMTVGDISKVWLRAYIPENRLSEVKLGQKMTIIADGVKDKTFEGTVSFISDKAEFTPKQIQTDTERVKLVYRIKIDVPNPDGIIKSGMLADATIGE